MPFTAKDSRELERVLLLKNLVISPKSTVTVVVGSRFFDACTIPGASLPIQAAFFPLPTEDMDGPMQLTRPRLLCAIIICCG